jgi:hypothetical protein
MMSSMRLELKDNDDKLLQALSDDTLTLAQIGVQDGMKIHVIDTSNREPDDQSTADVSFKLSAEEYEQRDGILTRRNDFDDNDNTRHFYRFNAQVFGEK